MMIAGIVVKVIGLFFSVPLTNIYGADGNGIFTQAYYIYTAAFIISTAGLPVAVSRMISESNALGRRKEVLRIFKVALITFIVIGVVFTAAIMLGAGWLCKLLKSDLSYYSVLVIAPSIFFVTVVSAIRGYYQGLSNMVPTAVSQVIEALGKLIFGLALAMILMKKGQPLEIVVAGAIGGVTIGTALACIFIVLRMAFDKSVRITEGTDDTCATSGTLLKKLIAIAIPITVGASVLSITNLVDMFVVLRRLQDSGMTYPAANYLYGAYGMAVKFFNVPQTVIAGIGVSVIPAISAAFARKETERAGKLTETALRLTGILAFPCAVGLLALAQPVLGLFYFRRPDDVVVAYPLLQLLTPSVIFVGLVSVTNAILQAHGKERVPVVTMICGGAIKLVVNYILVGTPAVNIHGAPIGTLMCYGTISLMNLIMIARLKIKFSYFRAFFKPAVSAALMGVLARLIYSPLRSVLGSAFALLADVLICVIFYFGLLLVLKAIPREDMEMMPGGKKIMKLLRIK